MLSFFGLITYGTSICCDVFLMEYLGIGHFLCGIVMLTWEIFNFHCTFEFEI